MRSVQDGLNRSWWWWLGVGGRSLGGGAVDWWENNLERVRQKSEEVAVGS